LVSTRISAALAALILVCTTALASPAPKTAYSTMTTLAQGIDAAAERGDWVSANRLSRQLHAAWADERPETLRGIKGQSYAQSFDASLKWISSAIAQRSARNVHDAARNAEKTLHELEERA
jgi:hypothetical protein